MTSKRRKHRWPFPSQDASPYRGVQLAALRACITDPKLAPDGFNDVLRAVWGSFLTYRSIPTSEEFIEAMEGLYDLLREAAMPDGVALLECDDRQAVFRTAKRHLDALYEAARACGVLLE
jgi:hypothetical protein